MGDERVETGVGGARHAEVLFADPADGLVVQHLYYY
jgi:hypothetical protein